MTRKGRIYKITDTLNKNIIYVGSTFNKLNWRWEKHKEMHKYEKSPKCSINWAFIIHGIENFEITLIKEYDIVDVKHLRAYEQLYINKLKCINKIGTIPFLYKKEQDRQYREKNKEKIKQRDKEYREKNKEKIKENRKIYKDKNKEKIKESGKEYYNKNKEQRKQYQKEYREKNIEKIKARKKQKGLCPNCKKEMLKESINRHIKENCKKRIL